MQELLWRNVDIDKAFRRGGAGKQIGAGENARPVGLWSSNCLLQTFRRLRLLPRITPPV